MKTNYNALFFMLCALALVHGDVAAAVRVGNLSRSYADSYNQIAQQRAMVEAAQQASITPDTLPVPVANEKLANEIASGNNAEALKNLDKCSMIYPNGEFVWDRSTMGNNVTGPATCAAVVEMKTRDTKTGSDVVLARARVAAGDSFKCNISEFPNDSYLPTAGTITFPADNPPTKEDVIKVMNEEQKQNAGLKIAAATLVGVVGGNIAGKNEIGQDSLMGTGKDKVKSSVVGGVVGASLMAGNVYAGKVAGDVILSAGINAVAGGVIGNMSGAGDSVLRIENCKTLKNEFETKCLWGAIVIKDDSIADNFKADSKKPAFIERDNGTVYQCEQDDSGNIKNCMIVSYVNVIVEGCQKEYMTDKEECRKKVTELYEFDGSARTMKRVMGSAGTYMRISSASAIEQAVPAMIQGVEDRFFGIKASEWYKLRNDFSVKNIVGRGANGVATELKKNGEPLVNFSIEDFYPITMDAEDGSLIDLGNRARMKSTLIGAGAGGALGGFIGYQGAQADIENRWVNAVREYNDSMGKIWCQTGGRFLSPYNDVVTIPNMPE